MKATFVVDCSITMSWCFGDELTPASQKVQDRLGDERAVVPAHWFLEVTNVLAMAEKHRRIKPSDTEAFLSFLQEFDIEVDAEASRRAFAHLLPLCRAYRLTSYDAAYLDLALRRRLGLASLDDDLRSAAKRLGIAVYGK